MPALHTYRIFISHAWRYNDEYYRLVNLLDNASNFKYANYSVPNHDPLDANSTAKLRGALKRQINPVEVVLIIAGMYANHSDWIQFEMDHAAQLGKPMIGVKPWGGQRTPQAVVDAVDELVNWSTVSIVDAIRRHARQLR